jgi:hypothetical protein
MTVFTDQAWWQIATQVVSVAAIASAALPVPKTAGTVISTLYQIINLIGANFGKAANVAQPGQDATVVKPSGQTIIYSDGQKVPVPDDFRAGK